MKATGEVMAIGRTFESSFKKAVTSLEDKKTGLLNRGFEKLSNDELFEALKIQDDMRIFRVACALYRNFDIDAIHDVTKIDKWFIFKIKNIIDLYKHLETCTLDVNLYKKAKEFGFLDEEITKIAKIEIATIEKLKEDNNINACFKMVDTCACEFNAATPYFYSTYNEICELDDILSKEETKTKKV
ncbi:MAG: hypothetical protein L6V95_14870 [Candidatus Melainabacteria bacterium]|nr:MAG: hypothetical protein L6V95_14870 [Candidatus Melainabacteria bacterium]